MYKHFIIISDSYQKGSRIGYKETEISTDRSLLHKILEIKDNLKENDIASYSTHLIETDKPSWKSIIDSDPFFKDILTLDDIDEFIEYLSIGISNLINMFEPEAIGIGGSFVFYAEVFLDKLKTKLLKDNLLFNERKEINIQTAILDNDAGRIGAVL